MELRQILQKKSNVLALVSFIAIVAISLMKSAMELEDAEQAYYSQWFRLGYDDQPPLYTWLQYVINSILGVTIVSFSLVRAIIFASIILALYHFSKAYLKDISKANLVVFSLAIIPVFIDFTFRRLSHTYLLCFAVVVTYMLLQNLISKKTISNYILLGLVVAFGILTKYNYVMVIGAIAIACFIDRNIRKILWNKKIIISIFIAGLLVTPHFYWLFSNKEYLTALSASVALKTMVEGKVGIPIISPLLTMILTLIKVIAPLVILLVLFRLLKRINFITLNKDWLFKMLLAQLAIIILFFVVMDVQKTEERWFLPLLFPFLPLLLKSISFSAIKKWQVVGFYLFLFILLVQTVRTPIEKVLKIPSDVHYGFQRISEILNSKFSNENWILPNVTYAGNIELLNSNKEVYASDDFSLPESKLKDKNTIRVVIGSEAISDAKIIDSIISFGRHKQNIYFLKDNSLNK
tara:strand:- start:31 stop:1422 length:1392 start_codon:yes stop_codon:yes gene_type:complete